MAITTEQEFAEVQDKVYALMSKGEENLTEEDKKQIVELGLAAQAYEDKWRRPKI